MNIVINQWFSFETLVFFEFYYSFLLKMLGNTLNRLHGTMIFSPGRPSALFNEDDFDYAIELLPDDEYRYTQHWTCHFKYIRASNQLICGKTRQTAEALPEILDFEEIDVTADDLMQSENELWDFDAHLRSQILGDTVNTQNAVAGAPSDVETGVKHQRRKSTMQSPTRTSLDAQSVIQYGEFRQKMESLHAEERDFKKQARR